MLRKIVKSMEMGEESRSKVAQDSAEKVAELVNEAAKDIGFYMQKAPLFDFTILNADTASDNASSEMMQVFINLKN